MADESRRPGDRLFDRIIPDATAGERELAHENLRHFLRMVLDLAIRDVREERPNDSREWPTRDTLFPSH
jgi:hypothetical protein